VQTVGMGKGEVGVGGWRVARSDRWWQPAKGGSMHDRVAVHDVMRGCEC
jgi:hypothetical protein